MTTFKLAFDYRKQTPAPPSALQLLLMLLLLPPPLKHEPRQNDQFGCSTFCKSTLTRKWSLLRLLSDGELMCCFPLPQPNTGSQTDSLHHSSQSPQTHSCLTGRSICRLLPNFLFPFFFLFAFFLFPSFSLFFLF